MKMMMKTMKMITIKKIKEVEIVVRICFSMLLNLKNKRAVKKESS